MLVSTWSWLRWLSAGALLYPVFRFLGYQLPRQPRLVTVAKPVTGAGFLVEHDFILFVDGHTPLAVSRKCTHLGCRLNFQEKEGQLVCPCHQSRFSKDGVRLAGPARKNLPRFDVTVSREGSEVKGYTVAIL
ncbi:MAG: ubiquinol-cytochrome c reductase iron-sulfur subunit [Thermodesulfobacteriota bacterium]